MTDSSGGRRKGVSMTKKTAPPIATWLFWSLMVFGLFLWVNRQRVMDGVVADDSGVTYIIMFFFAVAFVMSLIVVIDLQNEYRTLQKMRKSGVIDNPNASEASAMFDAALSRIQLGEKVDIKNLVAAYATRLKARVSNMGVVAGMLITIGLIGTIIGLIIAVNGLGEVLDNADDFNVMRQGLRETFGGLGTAFYTTFFGAWLGGVVLKVIGSEMKKSVTLLAADALSFGELYVATQAAKHSSDALGELESRVGSLHDQLEALSASFGSVIEIIDSKQSTLADSLSSLVDAVAASNEQAAERAKNLVATVDSSLEETNRLADERLKVLANSIENAAQQTREKSDQHLISFVESVSSAINQSSRNAEARLNSKASQLAGKLSDAASALAEMAESAAAEYGEKR